MPAQALDRLAAKGELAVRAIHPFQIKANDPQRSRYREGFG